MRLEIIRLHHRVLGNIGFLASDDRNELEQIRRGSRQFFRFIHLPDREQQRRKINALRIRPRSTVSRIQFQRAEYVPASISRQRLTNPRHLRRVEHRRIIQTPLNDVHRIDYSGFARRLSWRDHALFAAREIQFPLCIAQRHFAFKDRQRRLSIVGHRQMKFSTANRPRRDRRAELNRAGTFAVKEINRPGLQIQEPILPCARRSNLQQREFVHANQAEVGQPQQGPTPAQGAQPVARLQCVVGLRRRPRRTSRGGCFHFVFKAQQHSRSSAGSRRQPHKQQASPGLRFDSHPEAEIGSGDRE